MSSKSILLCPSYNQFIVNISMRKSKLIETKSKTLVPVYIELLLFAVTCQSLSGFVPHTVSLSYLWGQVGTTFCLHWRGKEMIGTTCCEWIAAHIHRSFVDQGDKAGAHSTTGRAGLGNGGQETAALRPKYSAESNEGQLSPRIPQKLPERRGESRGGEVE